MSNLIKAELYQLKKSKSILILFFIIVLIMQCAGMLGEWTTNPSTTGSDYFVMDGNGAYIAQLALLFPLLFACYVCGMDFIDKTGNYEVMAGYRRYEIYFSKAIVSLAGGLIGAVVLMTLPLLFLVVVMGWGDTIQLSDVLLRCVLALFPMLRVSCEFIFLSFIVKNAYVMMALCYVVFIGGIELLMELGGGHFSVLLGVTSLTKLFDFPYYMTYTVVDLKEHYIYESTLQAGDVIATIVAALVFSPLFLYAGYSYFKKDDLN